ncbi:MAG: hypothetical protein JW983_01635 [Elusimicrobia bacterium]|nr:hypothetical protein [Elusimicrobiota bacterium]
MFLTHIRCAGAYFLLISVVIGFSGCGDSKDNVSFIGKWKQVSESEVTGSKDEYVYTVMSDGMRYRIQTERYVRIYDGSQMHTKYIKSDGSGEFSSKMVTGARVTDPKFWYKKIRGKSKAGEQIAGRETKVYGLMMNRPDGEVTAKYWIDAETGVLLKSIESVYSKQVSMVVTETTYQCQEIEYTDLDDKVFTTEY